MYYDIVICIGLYEIFLCVGMLSALLVGDKLAEKKGFSIALQKTMILSAVIAIAGGLFGAVLFQAFYNFMRDGKFTIASNTGMTFYGGLIMAVAIFLLVWFLLGKELCKSDEPIRRFGAVADIAACAIPMAHGFGRIGCLCAGCCHGNPTNAWYGIAMGEKGVKYVPIQLFEAIALFAIAAICYWLFFTRKKEKRIPLFPIYVVVYGIWRFIVEFFRGDDRGATIVDFLSPSQLIALLFVLAGIGYFVLWLLKFRHNPSEITQKEIKAQGVVVDAPVEKIQSEANIENINEVDENDSEV